MASAEPPAVFDAATLRYADLQLDLRLYYEAGDLREELLDEDEFEEAKSRYDYSEELCRRAWGAIDEVRRLIAARSYPFVV